MKNTKYLLAALAVVVLCCALIFTACSLDLIKDIQKEELPKLSIVVNDFTYNGDAAIPQVTAGDAEYELTWYSVSEAGELTELTSAPKTPGSYRVKATIKGVEGVEAIASFTINKATATVEIADLTKIKDGDPVEAKYTTNSDSTFVTIKYRSVDSNESLWTETAPSDVGEYEVRVVVAETANYSVADVSKRFAIKKAPSVLTIQTGYCNTEFFVSNDNKVESIDAKSDEGNFIKALLIEQNAVGKSIDEVLDLTIDIFKEKGYLYQSEPIAIKAENETIGNAAKFKVEEKLQGLNLTSTTTLERMSEEDIRDEALYCLCEYANQLSNMSLDSIKAKMIAVKSLTNNMQNNAIKDLFYVFRAKAIIEAKLEALKSVLGESMVNNAINTMNTEINNAIPKYVEYYLYTQGRSYWCGVNAELRANLAKAYEDNDTLNINKYTFALDYEYYDFDPDRITYLTNNMYSVLSDAANLLYGHDSVEVNLEEIEQAVITSFNTNNAKYINLNNWTRTGLFVVGEKMYYLQSVSENKTYYVTKTEVDFYDASLVGFVYEYDELIAEEDILDSTPSRIRIMAEITDASNRPITDRYAIMADEINAYYSLYRVGDSVELKFIQGEITQIVVVPDFAWDIGPATIVFATSEGQLKAYLYFNKLLQAEVTDLPCVDVVDCTIDEINNIVTTSMGSICPIINFAIDTDGKYTILTAEGTITYAVSIKDPMDDSLYDVIQFTTQGTDQIVYMNVSMIGDYESKPELYYSYKGTWTINDAGTIVWANFNHIRYKFEVSGNGETLTFVKAITGD